MKVLYYPVFITRPEVSLLPIEVKNIFNFYLFEMRQQGRGTSMLMLCCDDDDDGHHRECHSTRVWIIHTPWHLQAIMSPLLYNIYNNKWHFYAPTLVNIWHKLAISSQLKPSDESLSHWRWSVQQLVQSINQSVKRKNNWKLFLDDSGA